MAIAFVGGAFSTGSTTAGSSKTISYVPAANNTLVVFGCAPGTASVTNVTDTAGNKYYPRQIGTTASCWSTNPGASLTTAGNVITVTFSGSIRNTACVAEYSGATGIGKAATHATGSSNAPSNSLTTQNNNNLYVAGMGATGTATWSLTTGTALRINQAGAGPTTPGGAVIDNTSASPGSVTCTAGLSGSESWGVGGIELTTVQASEDIDNAWSNPVAPVPASLLCPTQASFDEQFPAGALPPPNYSRAITVDHTKVPSTQTGFPVLFSGVFGFLATVANGGLVQNANGYDIVFYTDASLSAKLNWEIESYDPVTGTIVAWIYIPSLSSSVDTTFYIGYGNSAITTDQSNKSGTWDSNYKDVLHLPNGTALSVADSTTFANNGSNSGATATTGQMDGGAAFDGSSNSISIGSNATLNMSTAVTASAWVNPSAVQDGNIVNRNVSGAETWELRLDRGGDGTFDFVIAGGLFRVASSLTTVSSKLNTWVYLVGTYDSATGNVLVYVNGLVDGSANTSGGTIASQAGFPVGIGADITNGGNFFAGSIDEVRISSIPRSADWILTEYNNQSSPSTFYSLGPQLPSANLEDESWWSSVMRSGATVALAASLSVSAMTGVAIQPNGWQDEVPQAISTTMVVEDAAPFLPPPIAASLQWPQPWQFDEQIPASNLAGQPDEDYWINPVLPVPSTLQIPQPWGFDTPEDVTHIDEDYWVAPPVIPATHLWPQQASFDEQIPAGSLFGQPDEDYWANPTAPIPATLQWPQPWTFDEQIPAGLYGVPVEDSWQNPVAPVAAALQWPQQTAFADEAAPAPAPQFDEDFWVNPAGWTPATQFYPQQFQFDPQEDLGHLDEDFWANPVAPVSPAYVTPQPWAFDEQVPAGALRGQPDEDFWQNPAAPVQASLLYPQQAQFDEQIPAGSLHGQPDEDYWINPVLPVPATLSYAQQWPFDEEVPAGSLSGQPDEDYWINPVAAVTTTLQGPQPWGFETPEVIPVADEAYWQNPVAPQAAVLSSPQPWTFDESIPGNLSGQPDEDCWQNPAAPVAASLTVPQPWTFDVQEPAGALYGLPTEEYWQNPTVPVAAVLLWPQPYSFLDELSAHGQPDEDFWQNPTSPVAATLRTPQQADFDEQIPAGSLYGVPNEDYWQNPVAPVAASLRSPQPAEFAEELTLVVLQIVEEEYWQNPVAPVPAALAFPPPWIFDEQIPAGLYGQPDEDLWRNPTPPIAAALQWPQPWQFDEQIPANLHSPAEETYWQNPVTPVQTSLARLEPFSFEGGDTFGFAVDEPWVNPAATANGWTAYCPQPFQFDDAALPVAVAVVEDYWQNPVAPEVAALLYPQQAVFDEQVIAALGIEEESAAPILQAAPGDSTIYQQWLGADETLPLSGWLSETDPVWPQRALAVPGYFCPQPSGFEQDDVPVRVIPDLVVANGITVVDEVNGHAAVADLVDSLETVVTDIVSGRARVVDLLVAEAVVIEDLADAPEPVILV